MTRTNGLDARGAGVLCSALERLGMMKKIGLSMLGFLLGCAGGSVGPIPEYSVELPAELMGAIFGDEHLGASRTPPQDREIYLQVELDRLSTAGWEDAERALIRYGKDAILPLIGLLDSTAESQAALKPLGREVRTQSLSYTVGQVAYHVLTDIFVHRTNYKGDLPPLDRKAWENWWRGNEQQIVFCVD